MRILFVLGYPGYLRYYDSTIELLAGRGHDVICVFEQPSKQEEGLRALAGADPRIVVKRTFPPRSVVWDRIPRETRRIADWIRYLDPRFAEARYLRERAADLMIKPLPRFRSIERLGPRTSDILMRAMLSIERHVPAYDEVIHFLEDEAPDVLMLTPLVTSSSRQPDLVKAARSLGIPSVLGVASWDHLTSKGLIRVLPDRVIVWNETQRREAIDLHDVPPERVTITGAQPWDRWFERTPSIGGDEFRARAGLPPGKPFVLFVGSTASISAPRAELDFVREWVGFLRTASSPLLRDLAVLVRPHPFNPGLWEHADLSDLDAASVYPRAGVNPVDDGDRSTYFDSMYYASAVVGINTSAMMESAIIGRPVLTIRSPRFRDSQGGTLHFSYLLPEHGGFVRVAATFDEHGRQLESAIRDPDGNRTETQAFTRTFVRPHGLDRPAAPFVADAIEDVLYGGPRPSERQPLRRKPGSALLWALGATTVVADRRHLGRSMVRWSTPASRGIERGADAIESTGRRASSLLRAANGDGNGRVLMLAEALERGTDRAGVTTRRAARSVAKSMKSHGKRIFDREQAKAKTRKARAKAEKERRRSQGPGYAHGPRRSAHEVGREHAAANK